MGKVKAIDIITLIKKGDFNKAKESIGSVKKDDPYVSELLFWLIRDYAKFIPDNVISLLRAGADLNYHENGKDTLYITASHEAPLFDWLLNEYGEKIDIKRFNGCKDNLLTALFKNILISEDKFISIFSMLVAMGVNLTDKDEEGNSFLHLSVRRAYLNLYLLLWLKGVNPQDVNNKGEKTYSVLEKYPEMKKVVNIIKNMGEPRDITDDEFLALCEKYKQFPTATPLDCLNATVKRSPLPSDFNVVERINNFCQNYKELVPDAVIPSDISEEDSSSTSHSSSCSYVVEGYSKSSAAPNADANNSEDLLKTKKTASPMTTTGGTLLINNESDTAFASGASLEPGPVSPSQGNGMDNAIGGQEKKNILEEFDSIFNSISEHNSPKNNKGVPLNDKCCACSGPLRDQCLRMYDMSEGSKTFCRNSILGFVLMGVFWILVIGFIFIGFNDF